MWDAATFRFGPLPQALSWIVPLGNKSADDGKHGVLYNSIPRPHTHQETAKLRQTSPRTDLPSIQQTPKTRNHDCRDNCVLGGGRPEAATDLNLKQQQKTKTVPKCKD